MKKIAGGIKRELNMSKKSKKIEEMLCDIFNRRLQRSRAEPTTTEEKTD